MGQGKSNAQYDKIIQYGSRTNNLDISHQQWESVPPEIELFIINHKTFHEVSLYGNRFAKIPSVFFHKNILWHHLQTLDLTANRIEAIPPYLLIQCVSLKRLLIGFNRIRSLPVDIMKKLTHLVHIDIRGNLEMENITWILEIPSLEKVQARGMYLQNIGEVLVDLSQTNRPFRYLNLAENRLTTLPDKFFCPFGKMTELYLFENQLKNVTHVGWAALKNLTFLDLSKNQLKQIPQDFANMVSLKQLSLAWNEIETLPEQCFGKLVAMEDLMLDHNKLSALPNDFGNMSNLAILNLSCNRLVSISNVAFKSMGKLSELYLSSNLLTNVDFLASCVSIKLYRARFGYLQLQLFPYCPVLQGIQELVLTGNAGLKLDPLILEKCPHLVRLYIGDTGINTNLHKLTTLASLQHLSLFNNNLTDDAIPASSWFLEKGLYPKFKSLDVSYNSLTCAKHWNNEFLKQISQVIDEDAHPELLYNENLNTEANTFWNKHLNIQESSKVSFGFAEFQGPIRNSMEDAVMLCGNLVETDHIHVDLFGIFDGHGGSDASCYVAKILPTLVKHGFSNLKKAAEPSVYESILVDALKKVNQQMRDKDFKDGCTAVVIMLVNDYVIAANIGDARAVLGVHRDDGIEATRLTFDHKPAEYNEVKRIQGLGGVVIDNRVAGLAVSRSLGDFFNRYVSDVPFTKILSKPPVQEHAEHWFIVMACDGVWDVVSDEQAVEFVGSYIYGSKEKNRNRQMGLASSKLRDFAFACGSTDNITCCVIDIKTYA